MKLNLKNETDAGSNVVRGAFTNPANIDQTFEPLAPQSGKPGLICNA